MESSPRTHASTLARTPPSRLRSSIVQKRCTYLQEEIALLFTSSVRSDLAAQSHKWCLCCFVMEVPPGYAYVILVAVLMFFIIFAQIIRVSMLRSRYKIEYPKMVSEEYEDFNCAQRVHHNTLEQLPLFLAYLAFGGIGYPIWAASFGAAYLVGRILYSVGYWTGKPAARIPGSFIGTFLGLFPLIGTSVASAGLIEGWW